MMEHPPTASAAHKTFATTELLEGILVHLDDKSIRSASQVDRT